MYSATDNKSVFECLLWVPLPLRSSGTHLFTCKNFGLTKVAEVFCLQGSGLEKKYIKQNKQCTYK